MRKGPRIKTANVPKEPSFVLLKQDCVYQWTGKPLSEDIRLCPQERKIVELLIEHGPLKLWQLVELLAANIKTKQKPKNVLSYYQSKLLNLGYITFQHPYRL